MKRSWSVWLVFVACFALVSAAMGWVTYTALRLDRAESAARREAALEENIRLALWRLDAALAPIVAQQSALPIFAYRTGRVDMPNSAFPAYQSSFVRAHFQFEPDGRLTFPETPEATEIQAAVSPYPVVERVSESAADRVRTLCRDELLSRLPESPGEAPTAPQAENLLALTESSAGLAAAGARLPPASRGQIEFRQRGAVVSNSSAIAQNQNWMQNLAEPSLASEFLQSSELLGVPMTPVWLGDELVLARRVPLDRGTYLQGCLLDWPRIEAWLTALAEDLLPNASLQPVRVATATGEARRLAALPVRLVPGDWSPPVAAGPSPTRVSLVAAWIAATLAVAAVGLLLWGVLRLSDRRATFVSAVTHELRTPLTTFQLYTEMLVSGMVTDPVAREEYLKTLAREAARLNHLVENVLAFARLERGRGNGRIESVPLGELLHPIADRLARGAAQAGMRLEYEIDPPAAEVWVRTNRSVLEQILVNLVDNACKYAAHAADRRIHLAATRSGERVEIRLRDHGPGIPASQDRRLFQAFSKSAAEAADSAPGVGLGLALSRRLARSMQGDLYLDRRARPGACFVLNLPSTPPEPLA